LDFSVLSEKNENLHRNLRLNIFPKQV